MRVFSSVLAIAMVLPANVLAQPKPKASPDQFDLACVRQEMVSGQSMPPARFHIDLAKKEWCQEGGDCPVPLIVEADKLWLRTAETNISPAGTIILNWWIDRASGALHMNRDFNRQKVRIEGQCQVEPYKSVTKKLF